MTVGSLKESRAISMLSAVMVDGEMALSPLSIFLKTVEPQLPGSNASDGICQREPLRSRVFIASECWNCALADFRSFDGRLRGFAVAEIGPVMVTLYPIPS